ncbi:MAG: SDR family oxidoreductase [Streptosporangiales bacterium]
MVRTRTSRADLAGRVVAITGGARGIGKATAAAFVSSGATVAIGDLDTEMVADTATELAARPGARVAGFGLDVTDAGSFADFLDNAEARLGPVDVLVNNAGIMPTGRYLDEDHAMTERMLAVNVTGVLNGSRLAAARFAARGSGHLVNIASLAGAMGQAGLATYCGTKHFVVGFTEALYRELREHHVEVTTVLPGVIRTELSAGLKVPGWAERLTMADPEDVADAVVAGVSGRRDRVVVPRSFGTALKVMSLLPGRWRLGVERALNLDAAVTGADPEMREAYHRRVAGQAD